MWHSVCCQCVLLVRHSVCCLSARRPQVTTQPDPPFQSQEAWSSLHPSPPQQPPSSSTLQGTGAPSSLQQQPQLAQHTPHAQQQVQQATDPSEEAAAAHRATAQHHWQPGADPLPVQSTAAAEPRRGTRDLINSLTSRYNSAQSFLEEMRRR